MWAVPGPQVKGVGQNQIIRKVVLMGRGPGPLSGQWSMLAGVVHEDRIELNAYYKRP